jgi:aryl-alcohol dehydrogenase-like predicted oxidoreductase
MAEAGKQFRRVNGHRSLGPPPKFHGLRDILLIDLTSVRQAHCRASLAAARPNVEGRRAAAGGPSRRNRATPTSCRHKEKEVKYTRLGITDLQVSQVSLGTAPFGDLFGKTTDEQTRATTHHALDAGINFFDSSPYYGGGLAEERLGRALRGHRQHVFIGTKAGRYGADDFDFTPQRIRESLETSLRLLQTDYVDIFQLHDVEFVQLEPVFTDSYAELTRLRDEGKCRYIGMTGYPIKTLTRAATETDIDTILSYCHFTLLNTQLADELQPVCEKNGVGLFNAAAVHLGLLTRSGLRTTAPAGKDVEQVAHTVVELCERNGIDPAFLANQFAIQRSGTASTVIGTTKVHHLDSAVTAAEAPINEDVLATVLAATAPIRRKSWVSGLAENN